jgi:hypothetical protein
MQLEQVIDELHRALDQFGQGDPEPVKAIYSHSADASLANPWGPPVVGWEQVSAALESAAARFKDGRVTAFDALTKHVTSELACFLDLEHWQAKVGGRDETSLFDLRVTSIYRVEGDTWALVHRHADPITAPKAPDAVIGN